MISYILLNKIPVLTTSMNYCIDLFIINSFLSFQLTSSNLAGSLNFHEFTITIFETNFPKIFPRSWKFSPKTFEDDFK